MGYTKITALALGLIFLALGSYQHGVKVTKAHYENKISKQAEAAATQKATLEAAARKAEHRAQELTDELAKTKADARRTEATLRGDVQRLVAEYRPPANPSCDDVDPEWVRTHDASLPGGAPAPASATSGLTSARGRALAIITHNNLLLSSCLSDLATWQSWWEVVRE